MPGYGCRTDYLEGSNGSALDLRKQPSFPFCLFSLSGWPRSRRECEPVRNFSGCRSAFPSLDFRLQEHRGTLLAPHSQASSPEQQATLGFICGVSSQKPGKTEAAPRELRGLGTRSSHLYPPISDIASTFINITCFLFTTMQM